LKITSVSFAPEPPQTRKTDPGTGADRGVLRRQASLNLRVAAITNFKTDFFNGIGHDRTAPGLMMSGRYGLVSGPLALPPRHTLLNQSQTSATPNPLLRTFYRRLARPGWARSARREGNRLWVSHRQPLITIRPYADLFKALPSTKLGWVFQSARPRGQQDRLDLAVADQPLDGGDGKAKRFAKLALGISIDRLFGHCRRTPSPSVVSPFSRTFVQRVAS